MRRLRNTRLLEEVIIVVEQDRLRGDARSHVLALEPPLRFRAPFGRRIHLGTVEVGLLVQRQLVAAPAVEGGLVDVEDVRTLVTGNRGLELGHEVGRYVDGRHRHIGVRRVVGRHDLLVGGLLLRRPPEPVVQLDLTPRREAERLVSGVGGGQIDAPAVVREVARLLEPLSARRNVTLRLDIPAEAAPMWGDRVVLRHALLAILTHAINLTEYNTIEVSLQQTAGLVSMQISGPAPGPLDPVQLGVAEGRSFVEVLKGRLTFHPPAGASPRWRVDVQFPAITRRLLLVVDNNQEFVRLVERYLGGADWDVLGAADVGQALTLAEQRHPRAILLDIMLPDRDGWDLLLALKASGRTRDIPVVVCSVLEETDVALSLGAAACLQKPVDQQQLTATLDGYR